MVGAAARRTAATTAHRVPRPIRGDHAERSVHIFRGVLTGGRSSMNKPHRRRGHVKTLHVRTLDEWREWLATHYATGPEVWLVFHAGRAPNAASRLRTRAARRLTTALCVSSRGEAHRRGAAAGSDTALPCVDRVR